ncbi:hypothetical protein MSAN_00773000 [Mycena sanguinolenta]|uniref:Uncharacterized protein n=1 Tax=Mycena sanguinolenta TaxID=230812 RepID=A0A8H7DFN9_9AGAR|nr:hypothetical protein MSAN_00773000 [Mycena sanguinolenta]
MPPSQRRGRSQSPEERHAIPPVATPPHPGRRRRRSDSSASEESDNDRDHFSTTSKRRRKSTSSTAPSNVYLALAPPLTSHSSRHGVPSELQSLMDKYRLIRASRQEHPSVSLERLEARQQEIFAEMSRLSSAAINGADHRPLEELLQPVPEPYVEAVDIPPFDTTSIPDPPPLPPFASFPNHADNMAPNEAYQLILIARKKRRAQEDEYDKACYKARIKRVNAAAEHSKTFRDQERRRSEERGIEIARVRAGNETLRLLHLESETLRVNLDRARKNLARVKDLRVLTVKYAYAILNFDLERHGLGDSESLGEEIDHFLGSLWPCLESLCAYSAPPDHELVPTDAPCSVPRTTAVDDESVPVSPHTSPGASAGLVARGSSLRSRERSGRANASSTGSILATTPARASATAPGPGRSITLKVPVLPTHQRSLIISDRRYEEVVSAKSRKLLASKALAGEKLNLHNGCWKCAKAKHVCVRWEGDNSRRCIRCQKAKAGCDTTGSSGLHPSSYYAVNYWNHRHGHPLVDVPDDAILSSHESDAEDGKSNQPDESASAPVHS